MVLETERLSIRKAVESDIEFLAEIQTHKDVQKYTGGVLDSYENTLAHIKRKPEIIDGFYIVNLKQSNTSIGIVTFVQNEYLNEEEILISIMPNFWGNGYGPQVLSVFKEFWLNTNNLECMFVTVMPVNIHSISMLRKEGFVLVDEYQEASSPLQHVYKYERNYT